MPEEIFEIFSELKLTDAMQFRHLIKKAVPMIGQVERIDGISMTE